MTLGFNPRLADVLSMSALEVLGEKQGRAIGAIGNILMRQPAADASTETGIGAIALGHCRCEQWGLKSLAGLLRDR